MCGIIAYAGGRNAVEVLLAGLRRLEYHIAVRRGCDVDRPRNLTKSVTVE
jgi:glucosamine 6-phosphate synthetase-like amidotransferase/phosphosugar isomerase protein